MTDDSVEGFPQNSNFDLLARLREAAENEYGPAFRAMQNESTVVHISRSVVGTPGPTGDPVSRVRSPEPEDFTANWPEPDSNFIGAITQDLGIRRYCRRCNAEVDVHPASLVMCAGCGGAHRPVHKGCLSKSRDHRPPPPGSRSRRGDCEEVSFKEYAYLTWLLDSKLLQGQTTSLHLDDLRTTWFGVPHDQKDSPPKLLIWPRLHNLLTDTPDQPHYQYPSLVSFVGDTGSGKSTIIKAMILMLAPRERRRYQVPVPGTGKDQFTSTSSDVHLYADPWTLSAEVPILFADCEGLMGTSTPVARRVASAYHGIQRSSRRTARAARDEDILVMDHRKKASMEVSLSWARIVQSRESASRAEPLSDVEMESETRYLDDVSDYSDAQGDTSLPEPLGHVQADSRDLITKSLYPRLLYAFSDVVCFVTSNSRASQDILWRLFEWSKDGLERTFNQRVRPGLIIIVNKNSPDYDDMLPSVDDTTKTFLESVESSSKFVEYQQKWRSRQRRIGTAVDLIQCYYDDFRVISLPLHSDMPSTASRVSKQIKRLYHEIRTLSDSIHARRKAHDLNMDLATFNLYFERSVEVLARDHTSSLDFHPLSENDSPLPTRFGEHMALVLGKMANLDKSRVSVSGRGEFQMIKDMVPFLACCILCQISRQLQEDVSNLQEELVDEACRGLERFRNKFWRCEAMSGGSRCQNYWESHDKGHQFEVARESASRVTVANGEPRAPEVDLMVGQHECSYGSSVGEFRDLLWQAIRHYGRPRQDVRRRLVSFATQSGLSRLESQRTCLACLSNCPTNVLPCIQRQHAICEDCIRWHTAPSLSVGCVMTIDSCPLGCQFREPPWRVRVKPKEAQSRILVLDGGGIRGVVELAILSRLMGEIRFDIPIQQLFDLVIGTSTGGIIALGVFEMGWNPAEASRKFRELAQQAFTKKLRLRIPVIKHVAEYFCTYLYHSSGIEGALKSAFSNDTYLFGQRRESSNNRGGDVKVGVVSCTKGRGQPCLIANYNRNPMQGSRNADYLEREDQQRRDFKIWQAARATSAAQTYFEPYRHEPTKKVYEDGAIVRNNPVTVALEEEKRIWSSEIRPDIVVSIGSGICVEDSGSIRRNERSGGGWKKILPARVRKLVDTGIDMVESTLDCEREWEDAVRSNPQLAGRFHRLDIGIFDQKLPRLDEVDKMEELENLSTGYLAKNSETGQKYFNTSYGSAYSHLRAVARQLLAALFYFSDAGALGKTSEYTKRLTGVIYCRLPPSRGAQSLVCAAMFRLRECRTPMFGTELDKPYTRDIIFTNTQGRSFDPFTLSAPVQFDIQAGSWTRTIEASFPANRDSGWATISGF
ncbi:hypothetical protein B0T26DRAFT_67305 [Lasiosphaeria miniovina]|uniref:PNPLA domain-containing protein n=1 Tax=Lasiosphaeria miniovina TaxID=1954250 RepID=A0AA40BHY3_9PEZI|nr:uncharacterized protein B0T26DRAFT_67305 [Lasiosphaeria miniovina]KAK0734363.1 hypothetical protein B0T26DRAFT_67305 [Lasiosphaeria miniovina]